MNELQFVISVLVLLLKMNLQMSLNCAINWFTNLMLTLNDDIVWHLRALYHIIV